MSIYADAQTPSQVVRMVNAVAGIVVARTREFLQLIKNRHDAAALAALDERMLSDIGLTRGDLRDAYSEPVWRDPTAILVSRVHERRINRRRAGLGDGDEGTKLIDVEQSGHDGCPRRVSAGAPAR